jgi:hypothetical protein
VFIVDGKKDIIGGGPRAHPKRGPPRAGEREA